MLKSTLLLALALITVALFIVGAWPGALVPSSRNAQPDFVPQPISLDTDAVGAEATGAKLLERAIANLSAERVTWLKTKIRQTMTGADSNFVADGRLHRGPRHCARLEMKIRSSGVSSQLLVVSDGGVALQERTLDGGQPVVEADHLPVGSEDGYLADRGCGGPVGLLRELQSKLRDVKLQTGLLAGTPVIQLKGDVDSFGVTKLPVRHCSLFLDARTLWPERIDWWGVDSSSQLRRLVRIEFSDHEVNRPLSLDECAEVFSYQPANKK